jgi:hypothetical protein
MRDLAWWSQRFPFPKQEGGSTVSLWDFGFMDMAFTKRERSMFHQRCLEPQNLPMVTSAALQMMNV